ncbi:MAG: hypothetical protein WCO06_00895 [Candidatus Roizmanbacteria bacterium]
MENKLAQKDNLGNDPLERLKNLLILLAQGQLKGIAYIAVIFLIIIFSIIAFFAFIFNIFPPSITP